MRFLCFVCGRLEPACSRRGIIMAMGIVLFEIDALACTAIVLRQELLNGVSVLGARIVAKVEEQPEFETRVRGRNLE